MTNVEYSRGNDAETLCMSCGLCCTGHLFSWVQIKAVERTRLKQLGLEVIQPNAKHHGFNQPCPLWDGKCSIYHFKSYPSGCSSFNCKLLRELLDESVPLSRALRVVKRTKGKIRVIEKLLPTSMSGSFRDRLIEHLKNIIQSANDNDTAADFRSKANELIDDFENYFGVRDFLNPPESE